MSYILDALKKAERERTLGDVPDLESAHWGIRRPERSWRWLWIVVVLLLFNAALLGVLFTRDSGQVETTAGTAHESAVEPAQSPAHAVPPGRGAPVEQSPLQETTQQQPAIEEPERKAPVTLRPRVAVQPHVSPRPAVSAPEPEVARAPAARVVHAEQPLTAEPAVAAASALPEWSELPLEFRAGFVLPRIDVHVYAEEPQRRFILVDLKKYREGETLESGAVLEAIQPGSIQLNYQGTRFRVDR